MSQHEIFPTIAKIWDPIVGKLQVLGLMGKNNFNHLLMFQTNLILNANLYEYDNIEMH